MSFLRNQLAEKEKLLKIIEQMKEGVIITGKNYNPIIINQKAKNLLEIDDKTENIFSCIQDRFYTQVKCSDMGREFILNRPETDKNNPLYISLNIQPVKNPQGETDSYVFFVKNITEQYLENRLRYDFLSLISHKLRTPLQVIEGTIDILKSNVKKKQLNDLLDIQEKRTNHLNKLINRLLYFIGIEKRNLKEEVLINEIDILIERLKEKGGIKYFDIEKEVSVEKIPLYKKIILEELLDNAFKFFSGKKLKIFIKLTDSEIEVIDNSIGIPPEEIEKIFEPFYQIDKYFTGQIPGAGLGLALVKRLTETYNGKIEIESKIDGGSKFKILFKNYS